MPPPSLRHLITAALVLATAACSEPSAKAPRPANCPENIPPTLRTGAAIHAFEHLGNISWQADVAAASGVTVIYATGLGADGYSGLPDADNLRRRRDDEAAYVRRAREKGIQVVLGYVCATSIIGLTSFDKNWPAELRARFSSAPASWRQQDENGHPLPSWYGGQYEPACMNHPDWREYERFIVRQQLETGHDGIFFDNPTVHPKGCYCPHCMERFAAFLRREGMTVVESSAPALRALARQRPRDFLRFRSTIARDFFAEMRRFARSLNSKALVTANNSLNSPGVLYSQSRTYGYNLFEMSQAEDFVVVEDMSHQPRTTAAGRTYEYGPTYRQLHSLIHGRPLVAVTIAEGDYHTPPNLVRLAMAEAAAHDASYMVWTTWPAAEQDRMIRATRAQSDLLRTRPDVFHNSRARRDVVLFLPFRRWIDTNECAASKLAATLSAANVQYEVASEATFSPSFLQPAAALVVEDSSVFSAAEAETVRAFQSAGGRVVTPAAPDWLNQVRAAVTRPGIVLENAPATVRAVVRDHPRRTVVHLLNLNVERLSSFEDRVHAATDIRLKIQIPATRIRAATAWTADPGTTRGALETTLTSSQPGSLVTMAIPRLEVAALVILDH